MKRAAAEPLLNPIAKLPKLTATIANAPEIRTMICRAIDLPGLNIFVAQYDKANNDTNIAIAVFNSTTVWLAIHPRKVTSIGTLCDLIMPYTQYPAGDVAPLISQSGANTTGEYFARVILNGAEIINVCCSSTNTYWIQYRITGIWTEPHELIVDTTNMSTFATSVFNAYNKYL
ncbi:hypothetical protein F-E9_270 [Faustovirus]|nr:hypothetical protein F-E9_270 [Faustovirus]